MPAVSLSGTAALAEELIAIMAEKREQLIASTTRTPREHRAPSESELKLAEELNATALAGAERRATAHKLVASAKAEVEAMRSTRASSMAALRLERAHERALERVQQHAGGGISARAASAHARRAFIDLVQEALDDPDGFGAREQPALRTRIRREPYAPTVRGEGESTSSAHFFVYDALPLHLLFSAEFLEHAAVATSPRSSDRISSDRIFAVGALPRATHEALVGGRTEPTG